MYLYEPHKYVFFSAVVVGFKYQLVNKYTQINNKQTNKQTKPLCNVIN